MSKRPAGALTEAERKALQGRALEYQYKKLLPPYTPGYYLVSKGLPEVDGRSNMFFNCGPDRGYYFTNYWHAWAYTLKLKSAQRKRKGTDE